MRKAIVIVWFAIAASWVAIAVILVENAHEQAEGHMERQQMWSDHYEWKRAQHDKNYPDCDGLH